jgi:predicted ATPase
MNSGLQSYITRLRVSNYKSIASLDLELSPLTVLVGPNGAGKSNVVDVLQFVRDILNRGLDQAILDRRGMSSIRRYSPKGRPYDTSVFVHLHAEGLEVEYGFTLSGGRLADYRVKREYLRIDNLQDIGTVILEVADGKWKSVPNHYSNQHLPQPVNSDLSLLASYYSVIDDLADEDWERMYSAESFLRRMGFYNISPDSVRQPQRILATSPLDENGQNLAAVLRSLKQQNSPDVPDMGKALGRLVEGIRDFNVINVGSYLVTRLLYDFSSRSHGGESGDRRMHSELSQESDGTLRILSILAAVYQQPPRPLVTIEEPELNIHPGALGVLADVLEEASMRSQVVITTHSPDLIDHFSVDALRVVEKVGGLTEVGQVTESQRQTVHEMLFSTGELMRMEGLRREGSGE